MKNQDFTTSFTVDHSPEEAFEAINNVRGWWSGEVAGETSKRSITAMALPLHSARNTACGSEAMPAKKAAISGPWSAAPSGRCASAARRQSRRELQVVLERLHSSSNSQLPGNELTGKVERWPISEINEGVYAE